MVYTTHVPEASATQGTTALRPERAISAERLGELVEQLTAAGFAEDDIEWSENACAPEDAQQFAMEAIFVICNSGMKNTVARRIYEKVKDALFRGESARTVFGHPGKAAAIDDIWARREHWYFQFTRVETDADRLAACEAMPWIGPITKYHLAKNFGVDVAKPDVHLQRLADYEGVTAQQLCERLARETGYRVATVDLLLWRACATGLINSRAYLDVGGAKPSTLAPDEVQRIPTNPPPPSKPGEVAE